jgi:PST family polysaccharide transporter
MTLIKTSVLNGIAVLIKMLAMLGVNKVLAMFVGPAGYAAIGQFQNAVQMVTMMASGAINTGVTKYTAEYGDDVEKQRALWRTAGSIVLVGTLATAVLIACFREQLGEHFLKIENQGNVFLWFAVNLLAFTGNAFLLAILNGCLEIRRYVIANIFGSLFAFIVVALMTMRLGLYGALVSLAIYQSLPFFVTLVVALKAPGLRLAYLYGRVDKDMALKLLKYAAMAVTAALCSPLSQIAVRSYLTSTVGAMGAGYWEALSRMSAAYLLFITTTLSVYYLPKLSGLKDAAGLRREVVQGYKIILPVTVLFGVAIYLARDLIIAVLFSKDFYPVRDLVALQAVGDSLKIGSWILSYLMLSKALTKAFIATELGFSATLVLLSMLLINRYGLSGAIMAYSINYAMYWITVFLITKHLMVKSNDE